MFLPLPATLAPSYLIHPLLLAAPPFRLVELAGCGNRLLSCFLSGPGRIPHGAFGITARLLHLSDKLPLFPQCFPQGFKHPPFFPPLSALVGITGDLGLSAYGARAGGLAPRLPAPDCCRLPQAPLRCPSVAHGFPPIVCFARVLVFPCVRA